MRIWKAKKKISYATSFFVVPAIVHSFFVTTKGDAIQLRLRAPGVWNLLTLSATPKMALPHDRFGPNMGHCL